MADRYWVGGTAAWDGTAGTKWSDTSGGAGGASVPTSVDDVFFTNLSTGTCTISAGNTGAKSINCTGFTGTLTGTAAITVSGNVTLVAGMAYGYSGIMTINATSTFTSAGKSNIGSITFNASVGTFTLADALSLAFDRTFTLTTGTLNLNGFTLTTGIFSSSNANTRSITFGSANIALISTTAATTILIMGNANNFTFTGTGGFTRNMAATATVDFGGSVGFGLITNCPNLTVNAGASTLTITNGSEFKDVNFTGSTCTVQGNYNACGTLTLASGGTYTGLTPSFFVSSTFFSIGKSLGGFGVNGLGITVTLGDALTVVTTGTTRLDAGTLALNNFTLSTGIFNSNNSTTRSISFGSSNIALTSTTAAAAVLEMSTATNFTWTGTGGFTRNMAATASISVGGTAGGTVSNAVNFTINAGASSLTLFTSWLKDVNFTGSTSTISGSANVTGNVTLASGGTYTGFFITCLGGVTQTITSNLKEIANFTINSPGGTVTLADALRVGLVSGSTSVFTLTAGTFNAAGFNVTTGSFSSSNSNTRTLNMGSGTWTITYNGSPDTQVWNITTATGMTLNASTSTINIVCSSNSVIFHGGGLTYNILNLANALVAQPFQRLTFTGSNTFNTLSSSVTAANTFIVFPAGATQTVTNFNFTPAAPVSTVLQSSTPGSTFTLSKASGTVTVSRCLIRDSIATGGATWNATESRNIGNNTGWTITTPANPDRYWVGGTASWDGTAGTKWALTSGGSGGATVPGLVDNAFLNGASGVNTVTIATGNFGATSLNCTGFTGTLAGNSDINIYGNATLGSGSTVTYNGVMSLFATATLTCAGKTLGAVQYNSPGNTLTLGDACTVGTGFAFTLIAGTLNLNGFTLSTGIFSSNNTNTRSITFGSANIALTSTTGLTTVLLMNVATNFTCTGTGGFTRNMAASATVQFGSTSGGSGANAPNLTVNAGASALTITANSWFNNINFTGSTSTVTAAAVLNIAGNLTLATGGTYTGLITSFVGSGTVTSNGKTIGNTTLTGSSLTSLTLGDALTLATTGTFTLTIGTLNLNGFTLSTGIFSSSNTNTRSIWFGSGNIALTSTTAATTVLDMATASNFNWLGTGGFTRNMAATATVQFGSTAGGTVTNAPNLTVNAGASALTITTGSWLANVIFTGSTSTVTASNLNMAGNLTLASGGTYTAVVPTFLASGTVTSVGKGLGTTTVNGSGITVTLADAMTVNVLAQNFTLTQGTINLAGFTLTAPRFSSSGSNTRAINFGSGGGITLTSNDIDLFRMDTATNFTWSGTGGITLTGGGGNGRFDFGSFAGATASNVLDLTVATASGLVVQFTNGSSVRSINCPSGNPSLQTISGVTNLYGNLTLIAGVGSSYAAFDPVFLASATITSAGKTLDNVTVNGSGITVTLADALTLGSASTLTLTQGTFTAANFNVTAGSFSSNNSNTRTLNMGSGTWTLLSAPPPGAWDTTTTTGLTFNPSTSTISVTSAATKAFNGGGLTYYNLNQGGAGQTNISGSNAFNNITNTVQPATLRFTAGTTQTVSNFSLSGTAGNLITINSLTPGSRFTLSKASGTVNAQYLSIQDSNATGGAVWNALTSNGNVNAGNNLGWIFSLAGGNMFLMFI